MKILHVTPYFKPSWEAGGPPRSVYEISKSQVKSGHEVTVFTTDGFKKRLNVLTNQPVNVEGITTYYFRNLSMFFSGKLNFPVPYKLPFKAKLVKEFDIIHIHEHRTLLAAIVYYYAKHYNIPYIVQPRGSAMATSKSTQKELFDKIVGRSIIDNAKCIIASSKNESKQYPQIFPGFNKHVEYIPNGINKKEYSMNIKKDSFRDKFNIPYDKKIILYLSRLHERKGIDLLIKSFKKLKNKDCILVIAGPDDHYKSKVINLVKELDLCENIIIPGPLYEVNKLEAYNDADIFVLPSKDYYESFGNVVIEAMAFETPVITTKFCGVSEWLNSNISKVINYDLYELVNSLEYLLNNSLNESPRDFVFNNFDWDKISETITKLYMTFK